MQFADFINYDKKQTSWIKGDGIKKINQRLAKSETITKCTYQFCCVLCVLITIYNNILYYTIIITIHVKALSKWKWAIKIRIEMTEVKMDLNVSDLLTVSEM